MRLPNQAKPVVRHAGQVEAGVNPSLFGSIIGDLIPGPIGDVAGCAAAVATCAGNPICIAASAPQCIKAGGGLIDTIGGLY